MIERQLIRQNIVILINRPQMFASCKESILSQICIYLELLEINNNNLFSMFINREGNFPTTLLEPIDDIWMSRVKARVLELVPECKYDQF